jgi:hypothetical protein
MQHVYQSFTTTDLPNWRRHTPAYSEEPQAIIELLINIIHNHQSHWDDCHQLMSALFTSDECRRAYQAARAGPVTQAPPQTANPERWADERIPDTRADWDPNTPTGLQPIQCMRQAILEGACRGHEEKETSPGSVKSHRSVMSCLANSMTSYAMLIIGTLHLTLKPPRTNL